MKRKISPVTRVITLLASAAMVAVLFLPIWRIELSAPQYPEGLVLKIYANAIGGDVDVVNGLNHYIGMRTLHTRDFVEFIALPYIIGGFLAVGLLVALINRRGLFYGWVLLFLLIAFTSMIDFYRWEYNYGHNLDEGAPIRVPGMAYQPPLIGYKQLLNFGAYSIPDSGGWIFAAVGLLLVTAGILEWKKQDRRNPVSSRTVAAILAPGILFMTSCTGGGPQPIRYGQDVCDFCKMGIADRRFGAEILTNKRKIYKFDDFHCLLQFLDSKLLPANEIADVYFLDFSGNQQWIKADEGHLLKSESLHSPMNGNIAAFKDADTMNKYAIELHGTPVTWKELYK
ncbi:nitrous oxide reductase accessory protein NosL [Flavitalea sp. BT771]|uniref:nitrous oxide reductase accessory protein NosL n=1 Tax=Flavitalea sp. BT771 TaxID=3063329 RepID=UPI0026E2C503|nr:nitrous oxide reductase accessory protein NosL [Flavitalea sp. BT771]MDO6430570.1 nitrous oxide reductase accessory protein NosL [Flavitalea sp. BT771]MDV6219290.1 nitrous oxide reductase accessory protein NosL [Flavitalea sp. BT771]